MSAADDKHFTLGNTTYRGDLAPDYISVQLSDGTIVTERTGEPERDVIERHQRLVAGMLDALSTLAPHCPRECATHNCSRRCGRVEGHPQDSVSCICDGCANTMAGEAIS